jgi:hypothetical protein
MFILQYYLMFLPVTGPWAILTLLIGIHVSRLKGMTILGLDSAESNRLARKANLISFATCMPIALFMPIWTLAYVAVYAALAAGIHYAIAARELRLTTSAGDTQVAQDKKTISEITNKECWQWSFAFLWGTVGWSLLIAICWTAISLYVYSQLNSTGS